jgi:hypothetical protein
VQIYEKWMTLLVGKVKYSRRVFRLPFLILIDSIVIPTVD